MSIWLPTGDPANFNANTAAHFDEALPCAPGFVKAPTGDADGYFAIRFSRFVQAWAALGEKFVSKELSERFLQEMSPYLNQPGDRVWDVVDANSFCGSPPPDAPELVNLDTQDGVFRAVRDLVYRRLWIDNCRCVPALPGGMCLTAPVVTARWSNGLTGDTVTLGAGGLTIAQGAPGGWEIATFPELFGAQLLAIRNRCFGTGNPPQWIPLEQTPQADEPPFPYWVEWSIAEIWIEGNEESCPKCPGPPPVVLPEDDPRAGPERHRVRFDAPLLPDGSPSDMPCVEVNIEWKKEGGEKVEQANIPIFQWSSSGQKQWIGEPLLVPAGEGGSSEELFRRLFLEVGYIKQLVGDALFLQGLNNVNFLAGGGPGEEFGYAEILIPWPRPRKVYLELVGAPQTSTREVRVFSPPQLPAGVAQGAFGWFSWSLNGAELGDRGEIWSEKLALNAPPGLGELKLIFQLKAGIGYSVSVSDATYNLEDY